MTNPSPIIIDLDKINSPDQLQTVHVHALTRLVGQVNQVISQVKTPSAQRTCSDASMAWRDSLQPLDQGLTCFIDGTRGAGKTTFLRVACHALCQELRDGANAAHLPKAEHPLGFLGLMDPTRVEMGEKILLNVVRAVQRRVENHCPSFGDRTRQDAMHLFRATLEKLAPGLNLLHEKHDALKDVVDPEVFVNLRLGQVDEGERLRSTFHMLLEQACQVLSVRALVLAFDDADTNAKKASEVMECLRKYLNSPRLVVLIAGDIELYAQLARRMVVNNIGEKVVGAKDDRQEQHHRMLDHLEEQYLLKVFPAPQRYRLEPIGALTYFDDMLVKWTPETSKATTLNLKEFTNNLLQNGLFVKAASDLQIYRDYFLGLPTRSILQVMARCMPLLSVREKKIKGTADEDKASPKPTNEAYVTASLNPQEDALQSFQRRFTEAVRHICLGGLYANGVNVDAIANDSMAALCEAVFDLCISEGDYDTAAYLRPQSTDENKNACFFALSAEVARLCMHRPDRMLRYLLQGPATVSLFGVTQLFPEKFTNEQENPAEPQYRRPNETEFKRYMNVGRDEDALNWAWHAGILTGRLLSAQISDLDTQQLPTDSKPIADYKKFFGAISQVHAQQGMNDKENPLFSTPYALIALTQELLYAIFENHPPNTSEYDPKDIELNFATTFGRTSGPPTISTPSWIKLPRKNYIQSI